MSRSNPTAEELQRVADLRAQRVVSGLAIGSFRCVAAGIRCWATFCFHTGSQVMPPKEEDVCRFKRAFSPLQLRRVTPLISKRLLASMASPQAMPRLQRSPIRSRHVSGPGRAVSITRSAVADCASADHKQRHTFEMRACDRVVLGARPARPRRMF